MNKVTALRHYAALEGEAKEAAEARKIIEQLRYALHDTIAALASLSNAIAIERVKCVDVMDQAHAVLMATLPGADLDAMSKPERKETLFDVISNIALPAHQRSNCDNCNERPWTHRNDYQGIETYVCDVCSP